MPNLSYLWHFELSQQFLWCQFCYRWWDRSLSHGASSDDEYGAYEHTFREFVKCIYLSQSWFIVSCTARKCIRKCLLQNVGICPIFCVFSMGKLIRSSQFFPHTSSTSWKTKFALTKMHLKMSAKLRPFWSVLNVLYMIRRIRHDFPFSFSWQVHHREVGYHVFHDPWHRPSRYWLRHGTLHRHSQPRPQTTHPSQLWHWLFRSRCLAEYGDSRWEFKIQHMFKIFCSRFF